MKFDDQNVDTGGVEDRRGRGRGMAIGGGGAGIVGIIAVVLFALLGGNNGGAGLDPALLDNVLGAGQASAGESDLQTRCAQDNAIQTYDDCYIVKVYNETDEVWSKAFQQAGRSYQAPRLVLYSGSVSTACGAASSQVGPFYCPGDQRIYLDLGFMAELQKRFGATGRYAQAYILAHEFGHHLQTLMGIEPQVRKAQQAHPSQANELSVRMELQADCFAGVWGRLANDNGNVTVTQTDIEQAQNAAAAVGDDRIQQQTQGRVNPEGWTHGSAQQRRTWYTTGYTQGTLSACDTFGAGSL